MKASALDGEALQTILLAVLERDSAIPDTRKLSLNDSDASAVVGQDPEEQQAVKGALDSLAGKQVRPRPYA